MLISVDGMKRMAITPSNQFHRIELNIIVKRNSTINVLFLSFSFSLSLSLFLSLSLSCCCWYSFSSVNYIEPIKQINQEAHQ